MAIPSASDVAGEITRKAKANDNFFIVTSPINFLFLCCFALNITKE